MSKFTSNLSINTRWRNNDFVGAAGSSHTFPDALHDEFLVDWAQQISLGNIVITETPTTGNIQVSTLTVGDIVLTGTATGDFGGGGGGSGTTVIGTSPISVSTSAGTATISLNANYQTAGSYQPAGTYVTGVIGTSPISATGTTAITVSIDQSSLSTADALTASTLRTYVKNSSGSTITKGQAVYVTGADGTNALIGLASASADPTSSKTLGIAANTMTNNAFGYVIENGQLSNIDTSAATAGSSVWLGATPGSLVFNTPPAKPDHSVYLGVVTKANPSTGEILVKVQNGYELNELHDVNAGSPADGEALIWQASTSQWVNGSVSGGGGVGLDSVFLLMGA